MLKQWFYANFMLFKIIWPILCQHKILCHLGPLLIHRVRFSAGFWICTNALPNAFWMSPNDPIIKFLTYGRTDNTEKSEVWVDTTPLPMVVLGLIGLTLSTWVCCLWCVYFWRHIHLNVNFLQDRKSCKSDDVVTSSMVIGVIHIVYIWRHNNFYGNFS